MGELQDPFLVCVHLLADPGQAEVLQRAADGVLARVHPELQLFRVSERAAAFRPKRRLGGGQPALAVIVFLQEAPGGEEQILMRRPPWRFHHTEQVSGGRRVSPLSPCSQDFFTLSAGTPLWAVRRVHYGKEIVRFTVYCRHENYADTVRLYKLLLQRRLAQKKEDFCFFVVYSNPETEVQLSFKRLPRGRSPAALDSAVVEVRVRDVGALVPDVRWRTEDHDGNKILLQVRAPSAGHGSLVGFMASLTWPRCDPHDDSSLHRSSSLVPPFRLNLDALVGAEETDVDTGDKVSPAGGVDLSVVSAYIKSTSLPRTPPPPPGAATPGRIPDVSACTLFGPRVLGVIAVPSLSDGSTNRSDSCSIASAPVEEEEEEELEEGEEEFYI
uniref:Family with sequence similarity 124 member A n=1 Tax=Cyclopterus lumpus TaxID=8103 RepID=A0A8C2XQ75_CYCLU